jgi:hypothetical protein
MSEKAAACYEVNGIPEMMPSMKRFRESQERAPFSMTPVKVHAPVSRNSAICARASFLKQPADRERRHLPTPIDRGIRDRAVEAREHTAHHESRRRKRAGTVTACWTELSNT